MNVLRLPWSAIGLALLAQMGRVDEMNKRFHKSWLCVKRLQGYIMLDVRKGNRGILVVGEG